MACPLIYSTQVQANLGSDLPHHTQHSSCSQLPRALAAWYPQSQPTFINPPRTPLAKSANESVQATFTAAHHRTSLRGGKNPFLRQGLALLHRPLPQRERHTPRGESVKGSRRTFPGSGNPGKPDLPTALSPKCTTYQPKTNTLKPLPWLCPWLVF